MEKKYERDDPVFTLLYYPERDVDEFLDTAIKVVQKRYGDRIRTRTISRAIFDQLQRIPDNTSRLFALIFMMQWETSLSSGISDTPHFRAWLARIDHFIDMTVQFKYNKFNVMEIVDNFVEAAKLEYTMGPL